MRLTLLQKQDLTLGRLVVSIHAETGALQPGLRVIASLEAASIAVAAIVPQGRPLVSEAIPMGLALRRLRIPLFEKGDRVAIHGQKATVVRHAPNELYVAVTLDNDPTKEILTNLAHVDANEILENFDPESTQLYAR